MASTFSIDNPTELENHLGNNLYVSGSELPNQEDARVLASITSCPDRIKYPNTFAWWWNLSLFQPAATQLWGNNAQCDATTGVCKKPVGKPVGKPAPKKAEAEEEDDDDVDDVDLFGGVTEEDKAALEADKKKKEEEKKKAKKVVIAKSRVTFDVKGYEVDQDFNALAKKIMDGLQKDGLVWQDSFEIVPIGFGISCLRLTMIIEDDKISTDDIFEYISTTFEDEVQSCDIHEFNKV